MRKRGWAGGGLGEEHAAGGGEGVQADGEVGQGGGTRSATRSCTIRTGSTSSTTSTSSSNRTSDVDLPKQRTGQLMRAVGRVFLDK